MMRPPRRKARFGDDGAAALASPYADEADGTSMRKRYAIYASACVVLLIGVIALASGRGKNKGGGGNTVGSTFKPNSSGGGGGYTIESNVEYGTNKDDDDATMSAEVKVFKHKRSGMQVMSVVPKDKTQDATFGLSFRGLPDNNHGTASVVQESLLTGSKNFPIKDPFNQLMRGSLQTYMDSWTDKDRSGMLFSSRNKQDFQNAIHVYLDAVFYPLMPEAEHAWSFRQEGWRLEVDDAGTLTLNGNAVNEAKASQMRPENAITSYIYGALFQDHTYGYNEKGTLNDIVSLTHSEMVEFYKTYYQPINGQAYCYGPQSYVDACLDIVDNVLGDFDFDSRTRGQTEVPWQDLDKINSIKDKVPYPAFEDSMDFRFVQSWLLNDQPMDLRTELSWHLIMELLVGSPTAMISRIISQNDLGDDFIGSLDHHLRQWVLMIGSSGIKDAATVQSVMSMIEQTLNDVVSNGFEKEALVAAMAKLEHKFRDPSSDDMPQGAKLFHDILPYWNYDRDPKTPFKYPKAFDDLKSEMLSEDEDKGQKYLIDLITHRLLDNEHKIAVEIFPDASLLDLYKGEEQNWLNNLDNMITKEQGLQILRETAELRQVQERDDTEAALQSMPRLSIKDLDKESKEVPLVETKDIFGSGITMIEHELAHTNGMAYVDFAVDMSNLDFDDVVLIPLFCAMMRYSGTQFKTEVQFQRDIDSYTGTFEVDPFIESVLATNSEDSYVVSDGTKMVTKAIVRASCVVESGCASMFLLIKSAIFETDVQDKALAVTLLEKMIDDMEDEIQVNGHKYTTLRIASQYSLPGFVNEQWQGVTQLMNLRRALAQAQGDWDTLSNRLVLMQDKLKRGHRNGMLLSLTGDKATLKGMGAAVSVFVTDALPGATQLTPFPDFATVNHPWVGKGNQRMQDEISAEGSNEAFLVPTRVSHVGKGGILFDAGEAIRGADAVVLQYLGGYYLYDNVRFGLGAEQAWSVLDMDSGAVIYQSDRDPNIIDTLDVYEKGANWLWEETNGKKDLTVEAKGAVVGAIGSLDGTALQPSEAGYVSMKRYFKHDTAAARQQFRTEILNSQISDFTAMVERLGAWGKPSVSVVTNREHYQDLLDTGYDMVTCDYREFTC